MKGKQVPIPRDLRWCEQCCEETEDLRHLLFVCPCYHKVRSEFFGQVLAANSGLPIGPRALAALAKEHGSIARQDVDHAYGEALLDWLVAGKGQEAVSRYLTEVWLQRREIRLEDA